MVPIQDPPEKLSTGADAVSRQRGEAYPLSTGLPTSTNCSASLTSVFLIKSLPVPTHSFRHLALKLRGRLGICLPPPPSAHHSCPSPHHRMGPYRGCWERSPPLPSFPGPACSDPPTIALLWGSCPPRHLNPLLGQVFLAQRIPAHHSLCVISCGLLPPAHSAQGALQLPPAHRPQGACSSYLPTDPRVSVRSPLTVSCQTVLCTQEILMDGILAIKPNLPAPLICLVCF